MISLFAAAAHAAWDLFAVAIVTGSLMLASRGISRIGESEAEYLARTELARRRRTGRRT